MGDGDEVAAADAQYWHRELAGAGEFVRGGAADAQHRRGGHQVGGDAELQHLGDGPGVALIAAHLRRCGRCAGAAPDRGRPRTRDCRYGVPGDALDRERVVVRVEVDPDVASS